VQTAATSMMDMLGPLLCQVLTRNIGGHASRSELDKLSEPIKKLVARHSLARQWLEAALAHPYFPGASLSSEDRSRFVKKIIR
jgi:hypothetical protein